MRLVALLLSCSLGCRQTLSPSGASSVPTRDAAKHWEALLSRVVDENGLVDYDALEQDRAPLDAYIAYLSDERAWQGRLTRDWHTQYLNAFNALVLFQVLERGRPASVLDVQGIVPIPGFLFFHGTQFALGVDTLTLSEIENERLRWKELDYRDHSAMNAGAMSSPPMRPELYRIGMLQTQLDDQMSKWVADEARGLRIEDGKVVFNPIFEWYARDFSFFSAGMDPCTIAASHMDDEKKREALYTLAGQGCPRSYSEFDWSLNDASATRPE